MNLRTITKLAIPVLLFGILLQGNVQAESDSDSGKYSFNEDELFSGLSANLLTLIVYDKVPEKLRKGAALQLYDCLFQLWLVKGKHTDPFLNRSYVNYVVRMVRPYVDLDDPMALLPFYDGDSLNNLGRMRTGLEPLRDANKIFEDKRRYLHLVAKFSEWRQQLEEKGK